MHIPDGYLSPQTCAALYVAATPFWFAAGRRVRKVVTSRYVPLVSIGATYCFLIMMFNVPIPDGTTAHAVGGVLIACMLGPWAAVIAVSTALLIQALLFGDGGVLAFGANAFNMAIVMPLTGYAVYRAVAGNSSLVSRRRAIAAGFGGYVGLNLSALFAAVEFGLQPGLFHRADGTPLYSPFYISQTIPTMMFSHLLIAGVVEFALTAGVVAYLQRANLPMMRINHPGFGADTGDREVPHRAGWKRPALVLSVMALATPLGLIAPGRAFGEDAPRDLNLARYHLDAVPNGLRHYAGFFHNALFDGYGFKNDAHPAIGYVISAVAGSALIAVAFMIWIGLRHVARRCKAQRVRHAAEALA